jgi:tetratricopeptide (TPR) repeat protein/DNA-binding CsgD family transcriptional regulator
MGLLAFAACHSPQREARQMVRRAERLFGTLPDSTARLIDSVLRMPVYFGEWQRMDMALLQAEALFGDRGQEIPPLMDDDFFDDKPTLSTSPELERAAAYYAKKKKYDKAAHAALYSGFVQQHYNDKDAAMQSFKDAEHYGGLAGDSLAVAQAEYWMGKMLYYDGMEQEALTILEISECNFGSRLFEKALVQNTIAVCRIVLGDYENAEACLQQSLIYAEKGQNDGAKRKALSNYAVLYRLQGRYNQALDCLRRAKDDEDSSKLFLNYLNMGKVFAATGQWDSANFYYQKIERILPTADVNNETKVSAYGALSQFAESQNNDTQALKYQKAHESLLYEVMQQRQDLAVFRIQKQYDYESLQNSLNRKIILRHRIILVISILLFVATIIILILQYKHKQMIKAEADMRMQIDTMKEDLRQTHQALRQRVMAIYKTGKGDRLERILAEFAAAYPQGITKLQTAHPDLTESERNIVILSFLGFRTKEEAEILHLSLNTVEKYRTNIKKKTHNNPISNLI